MSRISIVGFGIVGSVLCLKVKSICSWVKQAGESAFVQGGLCLKYLKMSTPFFAFCVNICKSVKLLFDSHLFIFVKRFYNINTFIFPYHIKQIKASKYFHYF